MDTYDAGSRAGMQSQWSKITHMAFTENTAVGTSAHFGELATLSFHETKNFSCGEGGALLD